MEITEVSAREIMDSRSRPTLEATLGGGGKKETAAVPSGKSTGTHEALELRDSDGRGVTKALSLINGEIATALMGRDFASQREVDELLLAQDGTENKTRLGGNSTLAISMAAARLFAAQKGVPLWKHFMEETGFTPHAPHLFANVINGGAHADFRLPFQEYMLLCAGDRVEQSYASLKELFPVLGERLKAELGEEVPMGDEGGYSPTFNTIERPFEILAELIQDHPHLSIAIDAAASELYKEGSYHALGKDYTRDEFAELYGHLTGRFPLTSIEDPFAEDDTEGFAEIMEEIGGHTLIVGDDLTVTNPKRIKSAIEGKFANAVIIKPNQIGTVTETLEAIKMAREAGWKIIVSHRSGETNDTFIADLAYGVGADGIKAGGLAQQERACKYERLLEIEQKEAGNY